MTHPDGEISFFNDAAFDIAPTLADVVRYADVIFAARQAQPIPAVIPAPSPVITATTAVISAGKPESNATPVIPARTTNVPCGSMVWRSTSPTVQAERPCCETNPFFPVG